MKKIQRPEVNHKGHKEHEVFSREEKKEKRRGKPQD
jgi:hypothetical protein